VRGRKGSISEASVDGGVGSTTTPVLLLPYGWTWIPSKIKVSYLSVASVLRLALVAR
jgi:hypothetical protein